jgi:hypothetical protein
MTDYELASLFDEYLSVLESTFINFVSVLFAFLVAAYLASRRLDARMVVVVLVIYSAFALNQILMISSLADDIRNLESLIAERVSSGSEALKFHSGAKNVVLGWLLDSSAFVSLIGGYLGSILFFFNQRSSHDERGK